MPAIMFKEEGFIAYKDQQSYDLLKKLTGGELTVEDVTIEEFGINLCKLHININNENYCEPHISNIVQILLKYIDEAIANEFKYIELEEVNEKLLSLTESLNIFLLFKELITAKTNPPDASWYEAVFTPEVNKFCTMDASTLYDSIAEAKRSGEVPFWVTRVCQSIETGITQTNRFLNGSQFTIYVSSNYKQDSLLSLCQEVDAYIKEHQLLPGNKTNCELEITDHISFRQEFLKEIFDIYKNLPLSCVDNLYSRRIDAATSTESGAAIVLKEIEENPLYQYLHEEMSQLTGDRTLGRF